ncbi:hypothetical protein QVD17_34120 [Tagetes erecta]|uniref:Stomagen C-terminal domain-containing protein n=1 Tax=Tagetes erecta TaxID=13708 RepID=A0AAD8JZ83_TARER|nr:hypothetical protein QVD17_34120 [Tagetes erecta]
MANSPSKLNLYFLFFLICCATLLFQGIAGSRRLSHQLPQQNFATEKELNLQIASNIMMRRRSMIGSVKPICTYNECRGCRSRCRAEQVPVEGNDPINSAYHYRCICHSSWKEEKEFTANLHMESGPVESHEATSLKSSILH